MDEPELPEELLAAFRPSVPDGFCRCKLYDHLHPAHDDPKGRQT